MVHDLDVRLKQCRAAARLQQKDVIAKTGIAQTSISGYENGTITPTLENLIVLAKLYGVSLDYLCSLPLEDGSVLQGLKPTQTDVILAAAHEYRKANALAENTLTNE